MPATLQLHLISEGDEPKALTMATSVEQALLTYRENRLGQEKPKGTLSAVIAREAPFEAFTRLALELLFVRMFQADMAALAASRGGH